MNNIFNKVKKLDSDWLAEARSRLSSKISLTLPEDDLHRRIFAAQLETTIRSLRSALLVVLTTVACVVPLFWHTASKPLIFTGAAIVVLTCWWAARKLPAKVKPEKVQRAAQRHAGVAISFGVAWSIFTIGLGTGVDGHALLLIGCLQVAFICAGLALYLNLPFAFLCFACPISIPLVINLCAVPGGWAIAFVILPMFILVLFRTAVVQHTMFIEAGVTAERLRASEADAHSAQQARAQADLLAQQTEARSRLEDAEKRAMVKTMADARRREDMLAIATRFDADVGSVVTSVSKAVGELADAANALSGLVKSTARTASDVADRSASTSRSIAVLTTSAGQMVSNLGDVSRRVADHSARSTSALNLVDGSIERVLEMAAEASRVRNIVGIVDEITNMSELLAFNAQIEAARAGDAGCGFAVVATEVKSLAQRTAGATSEIDSQVCGIEVQVDAAIQSIRSTAAEIEAVASIAESIEAAMLDQRRTAEGIGLETASVERDADDVRDRMARLASEAELAAALTSQVTCTAVDVAAEVSSLRMAAEAFLRGLHTA